MDYDELFAATLDTQAGWLDLGLKGFRGYVFGIAFDEFMQFVTQRSLKGERVSAEQIDRAMQIADRLNLGVTQEALNDSTARVLAATPALREQLEREQVQRQAARAAFALVETTIAEEAALRREMRAEDYKARPEAERKAMDDKLRVVREQIKAQQATAADGQTALAKQRDAIAKQFPAYADLVTPSTPAPSQLRRLLGPGEAVLVVHPREDATLVWLVSAGASRTGFHVAQLSASQLAQRVAELRGMLDLGAAPAGREPVLQPALMHALYRDLLGPLEPALREVRSLIVATQGELASLPWGTLVTRAPEAGQPAAWLLRQMAVTQLPTPSALQALRRVAAPAPAAKALLAFGDPLFNPAAGAVTAAPVRGLGSEAGKRNLSSYDAEQGFRYADMPALPETRDELLALAAALGANVPTDLVLGASATRRAVLDANLTDRRVVAFATHGLMPGELPGVSKPALAMAADARPGESPLLELDDVLTLRLNAQTVLLSACNTAAGEQGGAAMSGLVRGFFFAGTRSVLATHWAVESQSAAALSAATFANQAKGAATARAESLRQAQLAMIDGALGAGRWAHPFYWAPYALFGDPQR
jgi:CHAT domain-containing protein